MSDKLKTIDRGLSRNGNTSSVVSEKKTERRARCSMCGLETFIHENLPFFSRKPDREYDEYYCGCRGWD